MSINPKYYFLLNYSFDHEHKRMWHIIIFNVVALNTGSHSATRIEP